MAECMFEPMTAAQFFQWLHDLPEQGWYERGWALVGWFMSDLSDEARAKAAEFLVRDLGTVGLPDSPESPSGEFSPSSP